MLRKAKFRIDFKAWQYGGKMIKMSENLILPYRTEETNIHSSSTVYRAAMDEIQGILETAIEIKHIYLLTEYEEINNRIERSKL